MLHEIKDIKELIKRDFADKSFTTGDIFYALHQNWNKHFFGSIFSILKNLTKEGFLNYEIGMRKSPSNSKKKEQKGAIYTLKQ